MKFTASLAVSIAVAVLLTTGCQSQLATEPTPVEATPAAFNLENAPTAELEVPDMMCEKNCARKVKEILSSQTGVKDVKVDFEAKKATLAIDKAKFDGAAAVAALVDYQFSNSKLIVTE